MKQRKLRTKCSVNPGRDQLAAAEPLWAAHLKQGGEHVERVHSTGAVRVAHELVDVAAPGLLGVVTGRGLKGGKDGREEGRGRGRHSPLTFPKAGKSEVVQRSVAFFFCVSRIQAKAVAAFESGREFIDGAGKVILLHGGVLLFLDGISL